MALAQTSNYDIKSMFLISSEGIRFDLKRYFTGLEIYESINEPFVNGFLTITDMNSAIEELALKGDETIEISWKTTKYNGSDLDPAYNPHEKYTFDVYSVRNVNAASKDSMMYTIRFISNLFYLDSIANIRKSYVGTPDAIFSNINTSFFKNEIGRVTPAKFDEHIIIPSQKPSDAIDLVASFATSEDYGSNYTFFETKDKSNFVTLDWLISQPPIDTYKNNIIANFVNVMPFFNIESTHVKSVFDTTQSMRSGAYGSKTIVHDIVNKSVTEQTSDYNTSYAKHKHLGKKPLTELLGTGLEKGKINVVSNNETHGNKATWFNDNVVRSNQFNNNITIFEMNNDPRLEAGHVIDYVAPRRGKSGDVDQRESGKYLIVNLRRVFIPEGQLNLILETVRESHNV
jgi:hypothetical protein